MIALFPGIAEKDLPEGLGWAHETVTLNTHSGTHIDAPYHFHPTSEGRPSKTIDEMPLELAYGDGVVLDMRHKKGGDVISFSDIDEALEKIEAGSYGICSTCDQPIPEARLDVLPFAKFCVECLSKIENETETN